MSDEIERKWRLEALPLCCDRVEPTHISQFYIFDGTFEIRIRKSERSGSEPVYTLTTKNGNGLSRKEWQTEIPKWVFDGLKEKAKSYLVKDRICVQYENHKLEFDKYTHLLSGLVIVECEFSSIEDATAFYLPDWPGLRNISTVIEVTDDARYKNQSLASLSAWCGSPLECLK